MFLKKLLEEVELNVGIFSFFNANFKRRQIMPKGYKHLTLVQRCQMYDLKSSILSQKDIAKLVGVSTSTISREYSRNNGRKHYEPLDSSLRAFILRSKASSKPRRLNPELINIIKGYLFKYWSPEQISGRLKLEHSYNLSHETIYQYIWKDKADGGNLYTYLRRNGKKYRKRGSIKAGRGLIPDRVDISLRPVCVNNKQRIGDWEGDTIIGKDRTTALLTLVDRMSKYTFIEKLDKKNANAVVEAINKRKNFFDNAANTITFDNGSEFSKHKNITDAIGAKCFFATPYHSWERGLNEHTNGLIRQFLPKGSDFKNVSNLFIQNIQNLINNRPRKVLGYLTPKEVFLKYTNRIALQN